MRSLRPPPRYLKFIRLLLLGLMLCMCGCNTETLPGEYDQKQVLEIVDLLNSHGISADAEKGRNGITITVRKKYYARAISLMKESNLPGEVRMSFRELVGEQGLLPSSREVESLRLDRALAVQLEDALQQYEGVTAVKVVVHLNFRKEGAPPGVSAVLQYKRGAVLDEEKVARVLLSGIPGVARENISIIMTPVAPASGSALEVGKIERDGKVVSVPLGWFLFWRVPEGSLGEMALTFASLMLLAVMVGVLVGYTFGSYRQSKYQLMRETPEAAVLTSLKLDKSRKSLPGV